MTPYEHHRRVFGRTFLGNPSGFIPGSTISDSMNFLRQLEYRQDGLDDEGMPFEEGFGPDPEPLYGQR